nr:YceI family protein [Saprospiraceae bacterium]
MIWITFFLSALLMAGQVDPVLFEGRVSFVSDAPLELIKASSERVRGAVDFESGEFVFSIPMNSFMGFNSELQREHYNENYLETHLYKNARYSGVILDDVDLSKDGVYNVRTKGIFLIHGLENERIMRHTLTVEGNEIIIDSEFTVTLSDYNIRIPKIVEKKIAPNIHVNLNVRGYIEL